MTGGFGSPSPALDRLRGLALAGLIDRSASTVADLRVIVR